MDKADLIRRLNRERAFAVQPTPALYDAVIYLLGRDTEEQLIRAIDELEPTAG